MSSKIIPGIRNKLAFRLTLWYAAVFTASLLGALFVIYFMITNVKQKHVDQRLLEEAYEVAATLALTGPDLSQETLQIEAERDGIDQIFLRLLDASGEVIASSDPKYWRNAEVDQNALNRLKNGERRVLVTQTMPVKPFSIRVIYEAIHLGHVLQIGVPMEQENRIIRAFNVIIAPLMIIFLLLSAAVGWFMANRALSGVGEVTKTASAIAKGDFDRRVQIKSKSEEIELLASSFNRMLDHVSDLMRELKEVTDNIAHDLKTPITRMRVAAETAIAQAGSDEDKRELAAGIVEECDNLLQMIDTMLMISKEESGLLGKGKTQVDISRIVREAFELFSPIAEEKKLEFENYTPDDVTVTGDLQGLQRMIINLLDNAVKYTPPEGKVTVSLGREQDRLCLSLRDSGIGIAGEDLPYIFKRLYRCDESRSLQGFGLGLSLALAVARAHGGDIDVASEPGKGSTFTVILPAPPSA
ncbi:MAG: ATP-binding protein [Syntrophales bacterium]|jgi:signal transduction histidine kinase|nr:ATP-binding protein [Syntrophales bacterium]